MSTRRISAVSSLKSVYEHRSAVGCKSLSKLPSELLGAGPVSEGLSFISISLSSLYFPFDIRSIFWLVVLVVCSATRFRRLQCGGEAVSGRWLCSPWATFAGHSLIKGGPVDGTRIGITTQAEIMRSLILSFTFCTIASGIPSILGHRIVGWT